MGARAFIFLTADESQTDIRSLGRDGFAARAVVFFRLLDADGDGALTPEEWMGEGQGREAAGVETEFQRLDADTSGDLTLMEYSSAGADRFTRARDAAMAAGWEDKGEYAAGIDAGAHDAEVVATDAEGLAGEDGSAAPSADQPAAVEDAAADDTAQGGQPEGAEAAGTDARGAGDAGLDGRVPVDVYRFGLSG
ncbi:hypothetical protein [Paracoccus sp. S-4012]|uniref:hypothetical protein n=1 Tax=Paracoccus sp. S-4012 TaxID=2665648 RepID=UPI0012B08DC4|nr:hypothetical protein [Paracoccus sp. S-4012]